MARAKCSTGINYNSFVIQPMYLDLAEMFVNLGEEFRELEKRVAARAARLCLRSGTDDRA